MPTSTSGSHRRSPRSSPSCSRRSTNSRRKPRSPFPSDFVQPVMEGIGLSGREVGLNAMVGAQTHIAAAVRSSTVTPDDDRKRARRPPLHAARRDQSLRSARVPATSSSSAPAARWVRRSPAWCARAATRRPTRASPSRAGRPPPRARAQRRRRRDHPLRPARPRRRRSAPRRAERDLHGRPEVRHHGRARDDLGE